MVESKEGCPVPDVQFRARRDHEWIELSSGELFGGKTVVVFSLPGAFTPTCSSAHVPRYNQLAGDFHEHGVDEIFCIAVNDAFVMNAWQEDQRAWNIRFLPDGNGEFSDRMGMLVDRGDLGFGRRSWRYSMLVRDGIIEKMFVEPEIDGDPYGVSDADTMLAYVAPAAPRPIDATVLSRKGCPHCARAKQALDDASITYEELVLNRDFTDRSLRALAGRSAFPQVFIDGDLIGGADELETWLKGREAA